MPDEGPVDPALLPDNAEVVQGEALRVAGVDLVDLAGAYGTPLFVYDEEHVRARCREARMAWDEGVAYATKAFLCRAMARLASEEGLFLDVSTGGELHVALVAGVPPRHDRLSRQQQRRIRARPRDPLRGWTHRRRLLRRAGQARCASRRS